MPERKTLNEDLFYRGSSANLPRLHTCENKVPFWDFSQFAVTIIYFLISNCCVYVYVCVCVCVCVLAQLLCQNTFKYFQTRRLECDISQSPIYGENIRLKFINTIWFFNTMSSFLGYLMLNPFL